MVDRIPSVDEAFDFPPQVVDRLVRVDTSIGKQVFVRDSAGVEHRVYADTGWRDITADLINGWTANAVYIRRENDRATFRFVGLSSGNATSNSPLPMYQGFYRSPGGMSYDILIPNGLDTATITLGGNSGFLNVASNAASITASGDAQWVCDFDPWPTSLPGVAA